MYGKPVKNQIKEILNNFLKLKETFFGLFKNENVKI